MSARMMLLASAATLASTVATKPATAGDFGISFRYSSGPRCYSTVVSRCYTARAPRGYVYYDSYRDYYDPVVYVGYSTPRVVRYSDCYPTTYRTTYSRSTRYTRPLRHSRVKLAHRTHHSRERVTRRHHYSKPRGRVHAYKGYGGSRSWLGGSYKRHRDLPGRYRSWRDRRHHSPRLRIYRR